LRWRFAGLRRWCSGAVPLRALPPPDRKARALSRGSDFPYDAREMERSSDMTPAMWSRLIGPIGVGAFYAVAGSILGAIVLVILGTVLDWPATTLEPPLAFVVVAFVSGVVPLFLTGFLVAWMRPGGFPGTAVLSVVAALVA